MVLAVARRNYPLLLIGATAAGLKGPPSWFISTLSTSSASRRACCASQAAIGSRRGRCASCGARAVSALADADRTRLAQMLGLLGSDHAGERDAAGLAAHRLVRERDLTWPEILCPPAVERQHSTWRDIAQACLRHPDDLSSWELSFLSCLSRFPRLSPKQRACLGRIADRVLGRAA